MHVTATRCIQDVTLVQSYSTTKVPQSGPVLLVPVQTHVLFEKPCHRVQDVLEKREWKAPASGSHTFVMVNGKITCAWLITQCK